MKKLLFAIACALTSFASFAQLVGPQPWLFTGPQITIGGSKLAFDAPLTTSIVPRRGDSPTFTRATTATVFDHAGILRTAFSGEARFEGARREENRLTKSHPVALGESVSQFTQVIAGSGAGYSGVQISVVADATAPTPYVWKFENTGGSDAWVTFGPPSPVLGAATPYIGSAWFRGDTPARLWLYWQDNDLQQTPISALAWTRVQRNNSNASGGELAFRLNAGKTQYVTMATLASASASTGVVVKEYVSRGVLSAPYHGAGVDGVKYFTATSGNTVDANGVVTESAGAAISDSLLNGYLSEGQRTNYALYSRDFTNAVWVKTNVTAALDQTGIDGLASVASKLTASAGNGTALQSITRASAQRVTGFYVKRVTGTGTIEITQDNGTTWTAITGLINGTTYTRVDVAAQTTANPIIGFRIVTSGDAIAVDMAQHEEAGFISSPIPTTSAAVTRNADDPALTPWAGIDTEGTVYLEFTPSTTWANSAGSYGLGVAGADRGPIKLSGSNSGVQALDGTNTANGPAGTPSGRMKMACRWGAGKMRCFSNNSAGTEANYDGSWNASELEIGRGNSINAFGTTRNVKAWLRAPTDAYLQGLTQ